MTAILEAPPKAADKPLEEFAGKQAAIAAMRDRYADMTCDTPKAYEATVKAISECRSTRTALDKRKKELNEDADEWRKSVLRIHKELYAAVEEIEEGLKAKKQIVDDAKAQANRDKELAEQKARDDEAKRKLAEEAAKVKVAQELEAKKLADEAERLRVEKEKLDKLQAMLDQAKAAMDEEKRVADEAARVEREKAGAEARKERERLEAERRAAEAKAKAEREVEEARQREIRQAEEARQKAERDRLEKENRELREKQAAADKAERERLAAIETERLASEKAEREAAEQLARETEEAARLEAIQPDVAKVQAFGKLLNKILDKRPTELKSDEANAVISRAVSDLIVISGKLMGFGATP